MDISFGWQLAMDVVGIFTCHVSSCIFVLLISFQS